ncbi:MAG: hypothetical protein ABEI78_00185 [Candidatus Nanohaloarchaea archaeon]
MRKKQEMRDRDKNFMPLISNNMAVSDVEEIVDADAYIEHNDGRTRSIEFTEIMDYLNKPLDRDKIEESIKNKQKSSMAQDVGHSTLDIGDMESDYFDHINSFDLKVDLHYGDGKNKKTRTLEGEPRTDVDMNSGIFPSIVPLQFQDSEQYLVLREMKPYDKDLEKWIPREAEFTGQNGYDWSFSHSVGTEDYDPEDTVDTFSYVPEPLDFLAIHGYDGLHEQIEDLEGVPKVDSDKYKIVDVDESENKIIGLRPYWDHIWDSGLSQNEAKKLGKWRGTNRGIGRTVHDMDNEFFHGYEEDEHFIGFYDNEFPIAVGSEKAFDSDEWSRFKENLHEYSTDAEPWIKSLQDIIRDEERRTAQTVNQHDINYTELIPRNFKQEKIPDKYKADKILD